MPNHTCTSRCFPVCQVAASSMGFTTIATNDWTTWNGPVCTVCGKGYIGQHQCAPADLHRKIADLYDRLAQAEAATPTAIPNRTASCPCRPENGGSGICGCVLNSQTIC